MKIFKKKIILITGHRKSGTSLTLRLFDRCNKITVFPFDFSFFYAYFPYCQIRKFSIKKKKKRIAEICEKHILDFEKLTEKKIKTTDKKSFINVVFNYLNSNNIDKKKIIFEVIIKNWFLYIQKQKINNTILIKETSQSFYYEELNNIFPNLKIINLVRDPRDNFAAIKDGLNSYYSKFNENYINMFFNTLLRIKYDLQYSYFLKNKKNFYLVSFEKLVSNSKKELKKICKFLDLKFDTKMIHPTIFGKDYYGNSYRVSSKKFKQISSKNVGSWKKRISAEEAMIIELFLQEEMKNHNYGLNFKNYKKKLDNYRSNYLKFHYKNFYIDTFSNKKID